MKLKVYNRDTVSSSVKSPMPAVSFSQSGVVFFNQAASNVLDFENKKYSVVQDELSPKEWFLMEDKEKGVQLRRILEYPKDKDITKGYQFNSVTLCKDIYESCSYIKPTTRVRLATEPMDLDGVKLFAIITKAVL